MNTLIQILPWLQIILSIILVGLILLQSSEDGLGGAFGGSDDNEGVSHTRRGSEKFLFRATIFIAILFVVSVAVSILL